MVKEYCQEMLGMVFNLTKTKSVLQRSRSSLDLPKWERLPEINYTAYFKSNITTG